MQIELVSDKRRLDDFILLPWKVYRDYPNWVPPLISEVRFVLGDKNPFFEHAEAAYFIARDEGRIIGRNAAVIDHNYNSFQKGKTGFFGFFECMPDRPDAAAALMDAAASWLAARGMNRMLGPMNPSTNDECGFLLEGFDMPPMIMMPYTPPCYIEFMERCGMRKAKDLFAYLSVIKDQISKSERLERINQAVRSKIPGLVVRSADMKNFKSELEKVKDIYNSAWGGNWGFVPMTDKEIEAMAKRLKPLIVPELLIIAEINGAPAAFFMAVPDYNQVLSRMNGRVFPFGFLKFLWYSSKITDIRVMTLGVKGEYRKKGLEGLLYLESFKAAMKKGYLHAEMSWVLEDNVLMQRGCELMGGRLYKKYRLYERDI